MPDNQANRPAMRAAGHSLRCYASFIVPEPIATGTVSTTPVYPTGGSSPFINVDYDTGAYTDVQFGMEIAFFDTVTGAFKARTHVRYGGDGSIIAGSIPVREYAQAMLNVAAGDTFKVYAEWRLHEKLTGAVNDFPPDLRFYNDSLAGTEPEPVVNSGGDWAGMVDGFGTASEQSYATVPMTGSTSFTVYPTGGTVNHDWLLPSGVNLAPGSSSSDADPVLRAGAGTHVITHEGEDDASGRIRASHPSIRVHNASDMPHRVIITRYEGSADDGWNWEIEVVDGDVSLAAIPDGCKCILWGRERYNGAWQSFRNASPGRSHILGVGYVARDTSSGSGDDGVHTVTFEVVSPLARMRQIKSYSKVMLENATPDSWSEIYELGVLRGILQITQYYLMLIEAGFDLVVDPDFLDERYPAHFLDATNFYDQIMDLAKAVDARLICDRTGRFDLHTHPAYIPLDDRAAMTVALELADADILDYEFTREQYPRVAQLSVSGVSGGAANNVPVFSLYPGKAPGEALDTPEMARLILDAAAPQDDINERAGRYGALMDMVYFDADGNQTKAFDLKLTLDGSYDVFDFYKEYVEVVITGSRRGADWSGRRFYLLNSSTAHEDDGAATTDLTLRMETNAAAGETYISPTEPVPPYTPPDDFPIPWFPPLPPVIPPTGAIPAEGIVFSATEGKVARIVGLSGATLVFGADFSGVSNGEFYAGYSNPYHYRQAFGLGDVGLESSPDVSVNAPFSLLKSNATLFGGGNIGHQLRGSIHRNGFGLAVSGSNYLIRTFDGWVTVVSPVSINGAALDADDGSNIDTRTSICMCGHNAGHIYAISPSTVIGGRPGVYRSTNYGDTWALWMHLPQPYASVGRVWLDVPYMRSDGTPNIDDASIELYYYESPFGAGNPSYITRIIGTTLDLSVWASINGGLGTGALNYNPFTTYTYNSGFAFMVDKQQISRVENDWADLDSSLTMLVNGYVSVNGWSSNPDCAIAWSTADDLRVTLNGGINWISGFPAGWALGAAYAEFSLWTAQ